VCGCSLIMMSIVRRTIKAGSNCPWGTTQVGKASYILRNWRIKAGALKGALA